ncbi:MAG: hypothetical protein WAM59_11830, partial [Candidatus Acidiferrales bacterium]
MISAPVRRDAFRCDPTVHQPSPRFFQVLRVKDDMLAVRSRARFEFDKRANSAIFRDTNVRKGPARVVFCAIMGFSKTKLLFVPVASSSYAADINRVVIGNPKWRSAPHDDPFFLRKLPQEAHVVPEKLLQVVDAVFQHGQPI